MKGENKALSMIVEIFPTYIFLTEYSHTLDEEFKYIKNLKWREPKSSQINLQSIETRLLHCKELFKIKKFIHKSIIEYLDQDYILQQAVPAREELYTGLSTHLVDEQIIDRFYEGKEPVTIEKPDGAFYINQYIMLVSNSNEKKTALARFDGYANPLKKVINYRNGVWGVKARNKEQTFALELLMDPSIPIVSLIGKAGSGKTLMAVAAGLEQVMEQNNKDAGYKRLIVSRPIQPMGRDLGYLPGTLEEKMAPWLAPIQDNLQFLMGSDKATLDMYVENGTIELEALTYIRGRSIANAYIIVDEAQNLTTHEMKTILTRVGEGTKIILTGDIEQIDNVYVDETTNGLAYAIERLKAYSLTGHVTLKQGERSKVADLAAKTL